MSKKQIIEELTSILAVALRHRIGSIVNKENVYADKYARDAEILLIQAKKTNDKANLNNQDKKIIKEVLRKKLKIELEKKDFISNKKFDIMDDEMSKVLIEIGLD